MENKIITPASLGLNDLAVRNKDVANVTFSTWVRVLLQNGRQGTVACKGRSDVAFSNKKPWKQKGTGRARAGTKRSPLWRGGGVIFGPMPRVRTLTISKNAKKLVLREMLLGLLNANRVLGLMFNVINDKPNTKLALAALKTINLQAKQVTLLVNHDDILTQRSFANLPNVNLVLFDQVNAIDLSASGTLVYLEKDLDNFKSMVAAWL
jgi:large subunit ribosomal protein L4